MTPESKRAAELLMLQPIETDLAIRARELIAERIESAYAELRRQRDMLLEACKSYMALNRKCREPWASAEYVEAGSRMLYDKIRATLTACESAGDPLHTEETIR